MQAKEKPSKLKTNAPLLYDEVPDHIIPMYLQQLPSKMKSYSGKDDWASSTLPGQLRRGLIKPLERAF
jgi:hypothetical protein